MAGGAKRPPRSKSSNDGARIADAGNFKFAFDEAGAAPAPLKKRARARTSDASPAKAETPHYHEHRTRLRQRFEEAGAGALADYELLEMLLFRIIPRRDTKPLAKALLTAFGDLGGVLGATPERLAEVEGAGPAVAQELKLLHAIYERTAKEEASGRDVISSWTQLTRYCLRKLRHAPREEFRVLFLDTKNQLIRDELQNAGTIDGAAVYPREVARRAVELGAAAVILVHNHPSGDPTPSGADIAITRDVVKAAQALSVKVHDHVIVGRNGVISMKTMGLM